MSLLSIAKGRRQKAVDTQPTIEPSWLARPAPEVAPDLIGCTLVRQFEDGRVFRGLIVETEAYAPGDPACHGYRRLSDRNRHMFGAAGTTYVYQIYGIHHCLNIVTDEEGLPSAVLIRALQLDSIPPWVDRTREPKAHRVAAGPGKLCRILGIDRRLSGQTLYPGQPLSLEHRAPQWQLDLVQTTRIGISQGTDLPWRWYLDRCSAVSKP
ncbi:MAG TPA: DNA-3-methyladenine glycosylase [Oscillatoriales cyanobacterium M59_W2019_021]|nr:MAG: DNA-3-methyladenine glycosylase [Cyanobacteria bacterium J055]HIK30051.1 DNA-3-methyladenine glycosylase [Oscillatoriales cyanobacterium M4454_W2019_049]HIK50380.1 DNA-3-methyladenine glycosylase [Oscillatoriales cyanobacterium M59_W2019_021]